MHKINRSYVDGNGNGNEKKAMQEKQNDRTKSKTARSKRERDRRIYVTESNTERWVHGEKQKRKETTTIKGKKRRKNRE